MNKIEKLDLNKITDSGDREYVDLLLASRINELIDSHNSEAEEVKPTEVWSGATHISNKCSKCYNQIMRMYNFCPNCGVKIKWNI